ncbi:CoA transferase, partial [Variovorax sp. YR752]|uniref:CoA transferase n=1 Tax=Variovorax sp. YR752 TaxID=1884383 RepID=UPI003137B46B
TALGIGDLSGDARFSGMAAQFAHKAELHAIFRERFASNTRDHWLAKLEEQDLLSAPVRDMREALVDPQTLHNAMILEGDASSSRPLKFIASPIQMSGAKAGLRREPPKLGQHTEEVLAEARALIEEADA